MRHKPIPLLSLLVLTTILPMLLSACGADNTRSSSISSSSISSLSSEAVTQNFTYDALGRLREIEKNGVVNESLQYDRAGNRCKLSTVELTSEGYCDE